MSTRLQSIRLLLISPRDLIRSGLSALLRAQPHLQLTGEFATPSEVDQADVVLWDVVGVAQPRKLSTPFVALLANPDLTRAWLEVGASGIILEESTVEEILDAIRQVARGEIYLPRELATQLLQSPDARSPSRPSLIEPLTDREHEVLQLLAQGLSNKDIAQRLYLSVRTVEVFQTGRALIDRQPPLLEQVVLAAFIPEDHFARHLRRMRMLYAERQKNTGASPPTRVGGSPRDSTLRGRFAAHGLVAERNG